ncbi:MAG: RHS repeat-associated core domain-containing protein, partial [Spirochaetales bacterium]|nr:RHS repeat-associated core domain-containing protein [Spirochaetales bacterium]
DPDAGTEYRMRNVMGTPVRVYDKTWLVWYDDLNRKTQVEYPDDDGNLVRKRITYDDVDLIAITRNTRGYDTVEAYDIDGNLIRITRPGVKDGTGTERDLEYLFEYNQLKQKTAFTDPLGERVSYNFDERGLLTRLDYGNGSDLMSYDKNGNLLTRTDRNRSLIKFYYDEMGRNIRQDYFTRDNYQDPYDYIELGYDGRGNLVKVDSRKLFEQMAYDSRARLMWVERMYRDASSREDLASKVDWITAASEEEQRFRFGFTYTPNDLVDTMKLPNGKTIRYHYDETKLRLAGIDAQADLGGDGAVQFMPVVTGLTYNKGGQVTRMAYSNNTTQHWEFDERKRIKHITVQSGQQEILKLDYKVDTENNILAINDNTFAYDEMDRLIKSEIMRLGNVDYRLKVMGAFGTSRQHPVVDDRAYDSEADFNNDGLIDGYDHTHACVNWKDKFDREQFTYDHNGNRRTLTQNGKEYLYHYSERNRLVKIERVIRYDEPWMIQPGQSTEEIRTFIEYAYDANGNTVERKEYNEDGSTTTYAFEYDIHNRLVKVLKDGVSHASYIYDNAGMRMYKEESGKRTYYFRNGGTVLYEVEIDDATQEVTENSYIVSGELIAGRVTRKNGGADELFYYHLDHLNSTKMVTGRDGAVVLTYEYRAFGTELDRIGSDENRFSYIGREFDEEINLYYVNARYYDATTGRFINVDPIQDGWNWYVYANNNPLKFTDPSGLSEEKIKDETITTTEKYTMDFDQARTFVHEYLVEIENEKERIKYGAIVNELLNYVMSKFPLGGDEVVLFQNLSKIMDTKSKNNLAILCSLMTVPRYYDKKNKAYIDNPLAIGFQKGDYVIELDYSKTEQEKVWKTTEEGMKWDFLKGIQKATITRYSSILIVEEKMTLSLKNKFNNNILTQVTEQYSTLSPGWRWDGERNCAYFYSLNNNFKKIKEYSNKVK